jgi:flagellin
MTIKVDELQNLKSALDPVRDKGMALLNDPTAESSAAQLGPDGDTSTLFASIDTAQNAIASYRATLGSVQSRLNSTINNIDISNENQMAAMSRIRDVDYAAETAKFTQGRILTSAGLSVLTQANSQPESVLQLLRGS